jgi:hypothetical protein
MKILYITEKQLAFTFASLAFPAHHYAKRTSLEPAHVMSCRQHKFKGF